MFDVDRAERHLGIAAEACAEVRRLRAALDAIRRANAASGCCLTTCASSLDDGDDCDCGYVEAAENVAEYAARVLDG